MTTRFYTIDSKMLAYEKSGVRKDFLTDMLGSITAEVDQTQTRTYESRYSAYGRNNWSTGTGCGFGWVGSYGYRETGTFFNSHYVRARHYSYLNGLWSTVDPLWPDESAYGYANGWATNRIDPSGKSIHLRFCAFIGSWHGDRKTGLLDVNDPHWLYSGDNRGFGGGSCRQHSEIIMDTSLLDTANAIRLIKNVAGISHRVGRWFPTVDEYLESVLGIDEKSGTSGGCKAVAYAKIASTNPFKPWYVGQDNDINMNWRVEVSVVARGLVNVVVTGGHDEFPDYEILVNYGSQRPRYKHKAVLNWFGGLNHRAPHVAFSDIVSAPTPECCS